jgi:hypothetical protein
MVAGEELNDASSSEPIFPVFPITSRLKHRKIRAKSLRSAFLNGFERDPINPWCPPLLLAISWAPLPGVAGYRASLFRRFLF